MTMREVADWLKINEMTVYRMVRAKKLPSFRVGAQWRLSRKKVAAHYDLDLSGFPKKKAQ